MLGPDAEKREDHAVELLVMHEHLLSAVTTASAADEVDDDDKETLSVYSSAAVFSRVREELAEDQARMRQASDNHAKEQKKLIEELQRKLARATGEGGVRVKREPDRGNPYECVRASDRAHVHVRSSLTPPSSPRSSRCRVCMENVLEGAKPSLITCNTCTRVIYHTRCAGEFKTKCPQCKGQTVARMTSEQVAALRDEVAGAATDARKKQKK
jgi:phage FluMu protein Com